MFQFFKKHQKPLFEGLCDIHNHLLPGIDDGSKSVAMSSLMLEGFLALGFESVIPTPHVYQELYPNTPQTVKKAFGELSQHCLNDQTVSIPSYAAEYMVDEVFMKKLETGVPSLLLKEKYILLEINFFGATTILESACFQLQQKNMFPILAHPERYHLIKDIAAYTNLKNKGFYFQLNALSLLGHYGPDVKQKAEKLLQAGLYDFVATDAHHPQHLKTLKTLSLSKKQGIMWEEIRAFQLDRFSRD
jgi:protein-tyrosine phosphatase